MRLMTPDQDYRSEKMESREGRGLALERRRRWEDQIPADVWDAAHAGGHSPQSLDRLLGAERAAEFRRQVSADAKEQAELMGFWLSWHLAGGFAGLESGGWNRATLFRKVKRFRTVFGSHPDEHSFDFIQLNPGQAWHSDLLVLLG